MKNLDGSAAVGAFESIRDIPYRIPLSSSEEDQCCNGKVRLLNAKLASLEIESRYRVCTFKWSDLPIDTSVQAIPHDDLSTHVYLEVEMDGEWIDVDPTWDSALGNIFTISEWEGLSSTEIAVNPIETYSVEESANIMDRVDNESVERDLQTNGDFYKALNQWLETIRS